MRKPLAELSRMVIPISPFNCYCFMIILGIA